MFDSKQTFTERITNAIDLVIDFSTLGEYGLEPAARPGVPCESRRHAASARARSGRSAGRGLATLR